MAACPEAAQATGFSYKTAWDAVRLLPRPAFVTSTGGKRGSGADVTEEGRKPACCTERGQAIGNASLLS